MGLSLLIMLAWLGLVIAGFVLVAKGKQTGNKNLVLVGAGLLVLVTMATFFALF